MLVSTVDQLQHALVKGDVLLSVSPHNRLLGNTSSDGVSATVANGLAERADERKSSSLSFCLGTSPRAQVT